MQNNFLYTLFSQNEIPYTVNPILCCTFCYGFPVHISTFIFSKTHFKIKSKAIFLTMKENPFDNQKLKPIKLF